MAFRLSCFIGIGCLLAFANAAAIDNTVYGVESRIRSSEELLSNIMANCFHADAMHCMKEKVLTFLDTVAGVNEEQARSFSEENIEHVIVNRLGRILTTNEFHLQLPQTFFGNSVVTYRADRGFDLELPADNARGLLLKKKLLLPVLLLLKLKMKLLMPIIVVLIGLKATKALILSKIAIKLVLGFLIYNLIKKLGGMKMNMMPMMPMPPPEPMTAYGAPISSTTASSYDPASWEPMSGGPYARWDSTGSGSSHNLAYSSYYPSSASYQGSSSYPSSSSYSSSLGSTSSSSSSGTSSSSSSNYSSS